MTCDQFEMDAHYSKWWGCTEWDIEARDGDMKIELSVRDESVQNVIKDNFENISETVKDVLTDRAVNAWDLGEITDTEKAVFLTILEKVMP